MLRKSSSACIQGQTEFVYCRNLWNAVQGSTWCGFIVTLAYMIYLVIAVHSQAPFNLPSNNQGMWLIPSGQLGLQELEIVIKKEDV